jgi:hypothetical protein
MDFECGGFACDAWDSGSRWESIGIDCPAPGCLGWVGGWGLVGSFQSIFSISSNLSGAGLSRLELLVQSRTDT